MYNYPHAGALQPLTNRIVDEIRNTTNMLNNLTVYKNKSEVKIKKLNDEKRELKREIRNLKARMKRAGLDVV